MDDKYWYRSTVMSFGSLPLKTRIKLLFKPDFELILSFYRKSNIEIGNEEHKLKIAGVKLDLYPSDCQCGVQSWE